MDYNAIIDAQIEKGRTVEITPDGTIRIHAPQQPPQEQPQPPQPQQPEPEAAPAPVEGPSPAPDSDSEWSDDPVPDDDETAPYHDRPPAEDDDVSLSPTEIEAPAPGEEDDAPPAPAPGQVADAAPPTEDPDQEAGAKRNGRKHASTIDRANELLAKGLKVTLQSAKKNVLRKARELWPSSNERDSDVIIKCVSGKIAVIKEALALGIDQNHITCITVDPAVAKEATGLLGRKIEPRPRTGPPRKRARSVPAKPRIYSKKRSKILPKNAKYKNAKDALNFYNHHRGRGPNKKKLVDWDLVHVRRYKEKLEVAYPDGIPSGGRHAQLRVRYAEVERLLAPP